MEFAKTNEKLNTQESGDPEPLTYANIFHLQDIIEFYSGNPQQALNPAAQGKPAMDNKCSKNHGLYNQTVILKGRIILPRKDELYKNRRLLSKFNKFRSGNQTNKILEMLKKKEEAFFKKSYSKAKENEEKESIVLNTGSANQTVPAHASSLMSQSKHTIHEENLKLHREKRLFNKL